MFFAVFHEKLPTKHKKIEDYDLLFFTSVIKCLRGEFICYETIYLTMFTVKQEQSCWSSIPGYVY